MAEKIKLYNRRLIAFLIGFLVAPFSKMMDAMADTTCGFKDCSPGVERFVSCGTSKLQKQICSSCTYKETVCADPHCSTSYEETFTGTKWSDSGTCVTYSNECTLNATSSQSCSDEIGSGTRKRTCNAVSAGGATYYMWGQFGMCKYTSCKFVGDVVDSGHCYCSTSCSVENGVGVMIAEIRNSSVCPAASSSSSS